MSKFFEVRNLEYSYGAIKALNGISLYVDEGEIVALIGGNGAGKTTTLRAISGLNPGVKKGSVFYKGKDISGIAPNKAAVLGMGQCIEGRHIFPQLSVLENLNMGAYLRKSDIAGRKRDMEYIFELFPILKERRSQMGSTLSGGEQQMLAIGRALMQDPELLLLDEPSLGLAPKVITQIFESIVEINRDKHIAILLVEQNVNTALHVANRGYVLETGSIILTDTAKALMNNEMVKNSYLGIE